MKKIHPFSVFWLRTLGLGSTHTVSILDPDSRPKIKEDLAMRLVNLEQNSPDWYKWRSGGVGASESAAILGSNPWQSRDQIYATKLGEWKEEIDNPNTRRGKQLEPEARQAYEKLMGFSVLPICGIHDEFDFIRASFDGYRDDGKLILELKCPRIENHNLWSRTQSVPDYYQIQVQHQLLVSGAKVAHWVSYCREAKKWPKLLCLPIRPDPEFHSLLLTELRQFWSEVQEEVTRRKAG